MRIGLVLLCLALAAARARPETLIPERLGVLYNRDEAASGRIARYFAARRGVPLVNVIGLSVPDQDIIDRRVLVELRQAMLAVLPDNVQSLLLVWSRPYAVECMSVTTAFAVGYAAAFCEPGCARTAPNPLFDAEGWLPADTIGWLPAMLLPSADEGLARALIERGLRADASRPSGTVYLVRTQDAARNVRSAEYANTESLLAGRIAMRELVTPVRNAPQDALAYFTGIARVEELDRVGFLPGAVADHLTSAGGVLSSSNRQMPALEWLKRGATGSYGTVSEPCNHLGKFPNPGIFLDHYLAGESLLEAYWKSVAMPGQGLFLGDPLARPFGRSIAR